MQPDATPAQPGAEVNAIDPSESEELFGKSGEPRRSRTLLAAFSKLLMTHDFWSQVFACQRDDVQPESTAVFLSLLKSNGILETFWNRLQAALDVKTLARPRRQDQAECCWRDSVYGQEDAR